MNFLVISKIKLDGVYSELETLREEWNRNHKTKADIKYSLSHELMGLLLVGWGDLKK